MDHSLGLWTELVEEIHNFGEYCKYRHSPSGNSKPNPWNKQTGGYLNLNVLLLQPPNLGKTEVLLVLPMVAPLYSSSGELSRNLVTGSMLCSDIWNDILLLVLPSIGQDRRNRVEGSRSPGHMLPTLLSSFFANISKFEHKTFSSCLRISSMLKLGLYHNVFRTF